MIWLPNVSSTTKTKFFLNVSDFLSERLFLNVSLNSITDGICNYVKLATYLTGMKVKLTNCAGGQRTNSAK